MSTIQCEKQVENEMYQKLATKNLVIKIHLQTTILKDALKAK